MILERRAFLIALPLLAAAQAVAHPGAHVHPHRRRVRRRIRRRIRRRRIRRHVAWRVSTGRRVLVVPLAVAVGWELFYDHRPVVVHEIHPTYLVVRHVDGKSEKIDIVKEDTPENTVDHEGSEYEEEVEEEVEAEE
jgi:hypothetical protein